MESKEEFKFPSNVKQIGSIDDEMKVYVEDFAYTYICQYARAEACKEKVGILVGKHIEVESKNVILISGIIQGKYSENIGGKEVFTDETWDYIKTRKEKYFDDLEILGWIYTRAGQGISISDVEVEFHKDYFIEPYQVVFLIDSIERMDTFYIWNSKQEDLQELKGYFIYYDKNEDMQEYMLDNKLTKSKRYSSDEEDIVAEKEDVVVNYRKHDRTKREEMHQKKVLNMLVGTSGVVVILCFLMGLLLVQNSERMNKLEKDLVTLNSLYDNQDNISNDKGTALVFASQDEPLTQSEPSKEEELKAIVTEASTEAQPTETTAEATTQTPTEAATEPTTQAPTAAATEPTTQAPTAAATQPTTQTPTETTAQPTKKEQKTHTVKDGESLSWISRHYYGTNKMINKIMEYNNIDDPDKIYIGMVIKLP